MSVDSFSSDSNSNSSPQNGNSSQAESGFEDDFHIDGGRSGWSINELSRQMTMVDPFSAPPVKQQALNSAKIRPLPPPVTAQKPKIVNQSAFYAQSSVSFQPAKPDFDDPLSNGKSLMQAAPKLSMPTIIKPTIAIKPGALIKPKLVKTQSSKSFDDVEPPSPPMPSCPPPPPPPEYFAIAKVEPESVSPIEPIYSEVAEENIYALLEDVEDMESFGIALYDFDSDQDGDLNFRVSNQKNSL